VNRFDDAHFAIHHPAEMIAILDRLQREKKPTTVELPDGATIVVRLLEVRHDARTLVFDLSQDDALNQRLFAAGKLAFVSELDRILIAFETDAPSRIAMIDGPAAVVPLPQSVTRLQRREWFRAALPVEPPVHCTVRDAHGDASAGRAIDLSCGGSGLVMDDPAFVNAKPGSEHGLILSIPEVGRIELEAELRTVSPAGRESDDAAVKTRLGFRFEDVPSKTALQIQRYVQHVEVHRLRMAKQRE